MKHDLIITAIDKSHKNMLAKLLCADPEISLQKALSMLGNLPVTYKKGLENEELKSESQKLVSLGAKIMKIESKEPKDLLGTVQLAEEKSVENNTPSNIIPKVKSSSAASERSLSSIKPEKQKNISRIRPTSKKKRSNNFTGIAVLFVFITFFVFIVMQGMKKPDYKIKTDAPLVKKSSSSTKKNRNEKQKPQKQMKLNIFSTMKEKKSRERAQKSSESSSYSDSAELFVDDPDEMIRFYKIAISINKHNFNAWNGLVNTYADLGMTKEAYKAKEEMKKIFGDEMFSIEQLVRPFGKLVSYNQDGAGLCRLEYKSKARKKVQLESDSYNLLRSMNSSLGCKKYSIYASTGKGKGLLVRLESGSFPSTFSKYLLSAQINLIE